MLNTLTSFPDTYFFLSGFSLDINVTLEQIGICIFEASKSDVLISMQILTNDLFYFMQ